MDFSPGAIWAKRYWKKQIKFQKPKQAYFSNLTPLNCQRLLSHKINMDHTAVLYTTSVDVTMNRRGFIEHSHDPGSRRDIWGLLHQLSPYDRAGWPWRQWIRHRIKHRHSRCLISLTAWLVLGALVLAGLEEHELQTTSNDARAISAAA